MMHPLFPRARLRAITCAVIGALSFNIAAPAIAAGIVVATAPAEQGPAAEQRVDVMGWHVESNSLPALSAATSNLAATETADAKVDGSDGSQLAAFLQGRALKGGFVAVSTLVFPETHTIELRLLPISVQTSGASANDYKRFVERFDGTPISRNDLQGKFALIQQAAAINGDRVTASLSNPVGAAGGDSSDSAPALPSMPEPAPLSGPAAPSMPLEISAQPTDQKTWGGAIQGSTLGQRYSGRDVVNESVYWRAADALQLDASASQGLPGLRQDSRGGAFYAFSLGQKYITSEGIFTARESYTRFKEGGDALRDFDVNGSIPRLDLQFERPLTSSVSLFAGLSALSQTQNIGAADLRDRQTFMFAQGGVNYQQPGFFGSVRLMQGLAGNETYNLAPLSGPFSAHFTALDATATWSHSFSPKWSLDATLDAQVGSSKTPSAVQKFLGGQNAGRAFTTGNVAGPDGVSASVALNYRVCDWLTAYAGVDGGFVHSPAAPSQPTQSESSVFIGFKTPAVPVGTTHTSFSADIGVAQPLNAPAGERKTPTVGAVLSFGF